MRNLEAEFLVGKIEGIGGFLRLIIIEREDSKGQQVLLAQQLDKYSKTAPDCFQSDLLLKLYSEGNSKPLWTHLSVLHNIRHLFFFLNTSHKSTYNFAVIESNYFFYLLHLTERKNYFLYKTFLQIAKVTIS